MASTQSRVVGSDTGLYLISGLDNALGGMLDGMPFLPAFVLFLQCHLATGATSATVSALPCPATLTAC